MSGQPLCSWGESLVTPEKLAVWALEPVWTFWRGQKSPTPARIETADRPAHRLVSIPAMLPQLQNSTVLAATDYIKGHIPLLVCSDTTTEHIPQHNPNKMCNVGQFFVANPVIRQ